MINYQRGVANMARQRMTIDGRVLTEVCHSQRREGIIDQRHNAFDVNLPESASGQEICVLCQIFEVRNFDEKLRRAECDISKFDLPSIRLADRERFQH